MFGDSGISERSAAQNRYLPFVGHIGPQAVLLETGGVLAMAHIKGQPYELADHAARNARLRLMNTVYRNIADDNVAIYTHLIRHMDETPDASRQFRSRFAEDLDTTYRRVALKDRLFKNDYFISLIVSPRSMLGTGDDHHP